MPRARNYREQIHHNTGDKGKERKYRKPIHQNAGDKGKKNQQLILQKKQIIHQKAGDKGAKKLLVYVLVVRTNIISFFWISQ